MKLFEKLFFVALIFLFLATRLYKITIPLADHHSWRQVDTAAVARNFIKDGFNFLRPQIDNYIPLHPNTNNNDRLFLVEPPVYNSIVAGVYSVMGVRESYARLVSILFSFGSMVLLYLIVAKLTNSRTGLLSAFFFTVLPFNVYYSRTILPEPMIIFLVLGMFYSTTQWLETQKAGWYVILFAVSAIALTQKAFPLFCLLPLFYLIWQKYRFTLFAQKKVYLLLFCFIPFLMWRQYIGHYPEGIPANEWLFNQNNIRFKGAFFYWIFARRIGELILGWWGLPLLVIGIIGKPKKEGWFFHYWLLAILIFTTVFAAGNVTHDYYQIPMIPIICVFLAKGVELLLFNADKTFSKGICYLVFGICSLFMVAFGWYQVRDFYNIQSGVDLAGAAVTKLTPKDALIITGDTNDSTLLYNTNRHGWTAGYASPYPNTSGVIEELTRQGASYYVTTKFDRGSDFSRYMLNNYQIISESDQYILFKLNKL